MIKQQTNNWYKYNDRSIPRESRRTDPLNQELPSKYDRTHHLQNTHENGYETSVMSSYDKNLAEQTHRRKQHFIKGNVPGGSSNNKMLYGADEFASEHQRNRQNAEKPLSFMYGTDAATNVGRPVPGRKPNNKLQLETRTELDRARNEKLAFDQDTFMENHLHEKRLQKRQEQEEKRRDLEMLRSHDPWGKKGHGAPLFLPQEKPVTKRTKAASDLLEEHYNHPLGGSGAGGGDVNRTTSGKPQAQFQADPELRFQKYSQRKDVDPNLRYKKNTSYGKELDSFLEEARSRKVMQRQESFEKELRHISQDPFGKGGGGAPMKNSRGEVQAAFPTTLSKDIEELRHLDSHHPHAYNSPRGLNQQDYGGNDTYDPWGKGVGVPQRDRLGRVTKQHPNAGKEDNFDGLGMPFTKRGGAGAPITDTDGRIKVRKAQTLTKTSNGQNLPRDFSPKDRNYYDPFGGEGGGAPVRNPDGSLRTHIMGKVEKEAITTNDPMAKVHADIGPKQEYLRTLRDMTERAHEQRKAEQQELKTGGADVAAWMRSGAVGQPTYDPYTKEIVARRKQTSDVTQQKLNIRPQKNEFSTEYHQDLSRLAQEREDYKRRDKDLQHRYSREHVDKMNSIWGRPGGGAPLSEGDTVLARKQKVGIDPSGGRGFRD